MPSVATSHQTRAPANHASVHAQLLGLEGEEFVDRAYIALLKRPADSAGAKFYLDRLLEGVTKEQILDELGSSEEATNTVALDLSGLCRLNGQQFIESSYYMLLGRLPEFLEGKSYYDRLLNGAAKLQILSEIASSAEGLRFCAQLPGFNAAIARYQQAQKPILGLFARFFTSVEGNSDAEIRLRSIEQHLVLFGEQMSARIESLELGTAGFAEPRAALRRPGSPITDAPQNNSRATVTTVVSASAIHIGASLTLEAAGLNKVPLRALELYVKLRTAAARRALEIN